MWNITYLVIFFIVAMMNKIKEAACLNECNQHHMIILL